MSRNLVLPHFPIPPQQYDNRYFAEVMRSFSVYLQQIQNPGEGRNTRTVLTDLPTTEAGLEIGGLFQVDGFVMVNRLNASNVLGQNITTSVGTVTVVTT